MNKYFRGAVCLFVGVIKISIIKIMHFKSFNGSLISIISPHTEISLDYGGRLSVSRGLKMRDGAKIRVRKGAVCKIGKNVSVNTNSIIACHECVIIGDNVQFSPNVMIYDHDHDYRTKGGIRAMKYKTTPVVIGCNCWVGANTVLLRGTVIGDNCVIGAGCILKGDYPANSVIVQRRETQVNIYHE